jgi:hypothetical protein
VARRAKALGSLSRSLRVRKTAFLSQFTCKRSFYQARLGTKVEKKRRFRRCLYRPDCVPGHGSRYWLAGERNGVFEPFLYKTDNFTRTGSGQTQGKHSNNFGHATGWQIPGIGTLAPVRTAPYTLFFAVCVSLALKPIIYQDRLRIHIHTHTHTHSERPKPY